MTTQKTGQEQDLTGYTPGPWAAPENKIAGGNRYFGVLAAWMPDGAEPYHPLIAAVYRGHGHAPTETAKANARLIAKAPEHYEELQRLRADNARLAGALEDCVSELDRFCDAPATDEVQSHCDTDTLTACRKARAALAKATEGGGR